MIKTLLLVVLALVAAVLIYATTRPDTMRVERSARIAAPAEKLYPMVADFHGWSAWSPWEKLDPAMRRTYGGAPSGKGATYAWVGNSKVGEGRMEILEAAPSSRIAIQLDFVEPIAGRNTTVFTFEPAGDATQVRWTMTGPSPYISKLMGVFVDMDRMIGKDFEAGLANLQAVATAK
jgi:uncharacterized protein YndB with AHSA1/START domain